MGFKRHFSRRDLEELLDELELPDGFMFGVANAGYQVEGGFNGAGDPLNNWAALERSGKIEPSGEALRFWTEYPDQLKLAKGIGLDAFRLSIEWSRVQPSVSMRSVGTPPFDRAAIESYSDMIAAVMKAGLEPVVTLHHFVHPQWLGLDFWLACEKLDLWTAYVEEVALKVNGFLVEKHSLRPIRYWITLNEMNAWPYLTYAARAFPRGKSGVRRAVAAAGNMIDAHCRAYDALHEVYAEEGWEKPRVSYNTINLSIYGFDKFVTDLLNARRNQVSRRDLREYLAEGKRAWDREIRKCPTVGRSLPGTRAAESMADRLSARLLDPSRLSHAVDAVYSSGNPQKLDYLALDFYEPFIRNFIKPPSLRDVREGRINFNAEHWEWNLNPVAMYHFLKAETINGQGLPLLIAENGMCYKVRGGKHERRRDGATIDTFLQAYLYETLRAMKDGVPVMGYLYWSMVDNYEWGSYEPRFGLYGVDRTRSSFEINSLDSSGTDAAGAYARIIKALRSGDSAEITAAFTTGGK